MRVCEHGVSMSAASVSAYYLPCLRVVVKRAPGDSQSCLILIDIHLALLPLLSVKSYRVIHHTKRSLSENHIRSTHTHDCKYRQRSTGK